MSLFKKSTKAKWFNNEDVTVSDLFNSLSSKQKEALDLLGNITIVTRLNQDILDTLTKKQLEVIEEVIFAREQYCLRAHYLDKLEQWQDEMIDMMIENLNNKPIEALREEVK